MKLKLATLVLAAFIIPAQAETIPLTSLVCNANRDCSDPTTGIALYAAPSYPAFHLYLNGGVYTGQGNSYAPSLNSVAVDSNGNQVQVQVQWLHWTTTTGSGRVHYTVNHWVITSGTVVTP